MDIVEHSPSILNAPTFCLHVYQLIPHKDNRHTTTLNYLLMNTPALFKLNYTGTGIQHPHKSNRVFLHTFLLHSSKYFPCLLPLPTFHMSQYHGGSSGNISTWHLAELSPSILKAPEFCIHVNLGTPHKEIRIATSLNELFMN